MPFKFGLRRSRDSHRATEQSGAVKGVSKGQQSLVDGWKDEQCEATGVGSRASGAVLQPSTAHGAAPVGLDSRPSLFRRTLSSLSLRNSLKVNLYSGISSAKPPDTLANGKASGDSAEGAKHSEGHLATDADHNRKGASFHNLLPRFHGQHHQNPHPGVGSDGAVDHGTHAHLPVHLAHLLHLPHILESKTHHSTQDVLSGVENSDEILKVLQDATARAKKIIETARGEREVLLGRAREEAEEEISTLREALEREGLEQRGGEDATAEQSLLLATQKEEELMRQNAETSQENMAASVALCVEYVLNVDTSLAPERRDALCNLRKNPPNFLRKSQAHNYPSVRHSSATRHPRRASSFNFSDHSWDVDPREFTSAGSGDEPRSSIYSAILGQRTYNEEDEFVIDFDELERPSAVRRLSTAIQKMQTSCGCFI